MSICIDCKARKQQLLKSSCCSRDYFNGLQLCLLCPCLHARQAKYCVDEVHYTSDMAAVLRATQPPCLHVLAGVNTDRYGNT